MLGKPKKTEPKLFYHGVSLERRMPSEHPLRKIKQLVDFDFIRSQVAELYGTNGNQSVDPAVILKLMFLLFYENIKSERALLRQLPLRLDWLWFCDYDLDEETPDHSVLSKARKRWGTDVFEQFFMNILKQCISAGLVDGETIYIDSSTIDANADIDKVRPQLRKVTEELTDKLEESVEPGQDELCEDNAEKDKLEKRVNPVDPDARIGRKYGKSTLGYKDHRVVDDKHGVITTTISTPANVRDDKVLQDAVISHQFKTKSKAKTAVTDKIYGTGANYKYLYNTGTNCCIPHPCPGTRYPDKFPRRMFSYDKKQDCYICPAGQKLQFYSNNLKGKRYLCERQICEKCELFTECVSSKQMGRMIERNLNIEYVEWADSCLSKHERKRLMNRRKYKAEGSFADGANNYGFKRARWRCMAKMKIQNLMIAAIQNLGKLLRYGHNNNKLIRRLTAIKSTFGRVNNLLLELLSTTMSYVSEY